MTWLTLAELEASTDRDLGASQWETIRAAPDRPLRRGDARPSVDPRRSRGGRAGPVSATVAHGFT